MTLMIYRTMNNLICDTDGVPRLVQRMRYWSVDMTVEVVFFNEKAIRFTSEALGDCVGLMQTEPTTMQWLQMENEVIMLSLKNWKKWFPHLRIVGGVG